MFVVMGIDPGLANMGIAVVDVQANANVLHMECVTTKKSHKKLGINQSDDNSSRARVVARRLLALVEEYDVSALCVEAMSFPRHASSSQKMGIAWGIVSTVSEVYSLPIVQVSPQVIKKCVCGRKTASKEEIQVELAARYGLDLDTFSKTLREHPYDALGAVEASMDSDVVRVGLQLAR